MKLVIELDEGLSAHFKALVKIGFFGNKKETAVYLLRSQIIDLMSHQAWRDQMAKYLPKKYSTPLAGQVYEAQKKMKEANK